MTSVPHHAGIDSPYAWRLAFVSMACIALGGGAPDGLKVMDDAGPITLP